MTVQKRDLNYTGRKKNVKNYKNAFQTDQQ